MTIQANFCIDRPGFRLDVALAIPAHGITALFGPSGCGKTTLLRAIAGLDRHRHGVLHVGDSVWQDAGRFVPTHQRGVGYVFQEASLFEHLTVRGNLQYGITRVAKTARTVSLAQCVALLGIGPLLDRRPATLSGGEKQRVAIARALTANPRLLLMDEPLAALDRSRKQDILPYIEALHKALLMPIIYVSHSPDEVARLADYLVLLDAGRVLATGATRDMLTRLDLPLAQGPDAEALIEATIAGHDDAYALTYLDFAGGRFTVARHDLPVNHTVRLRIAARDVSLTLAHQSGTSILNIFPATVTDITDTGPAQVTVRLLLNGAPLLSRVTRKSAAMLDLKPGQQLYAQAKSVALLS